MITANTQKYIAKLSSQNDLYNVVKAEFVAMRLAAKAGLAAATLSLDRAADVLLIERFDRQKTGDGW